MTILVNGSRFSLQSWHNGLCYNLVNKQTNEEYFCQGDDASHFEQELKDAEKMFPNKPHEEVLRYLWIYVYNSAATKI